MTEDNVVNQRLALRLLEKLGYRADVAGNGLEALEALERQPYDLVLMDVQMPEMDGVEATGRILERWTETERPWIVAMTAEVMQGDREGFLAAGMNDYAEARRRGGRRRRRGGGGGGGGGGGAGGGPGAGPGAPGGGPGPGGGGGGAASSAGGWGGWAGGSPARVAGGRRGLETGTPRRSGAHRTR